MIHSGKIKIKNDGNIIMQFSNYHHVIDSDTELYYKKQVDEVIAEKDAKIIALDAEVFKQKHHAKLFFAERNYAETKLRHNMYKRCLAMAEWCDAEADVADADGDYEDMRWYQKWHERWMELAEKFKEDK